MAPFIKCTKSSQTASGESRQIIYINVEQIVKATYHEDSQVLFLTLTTSAIGIEDVKIEGDEAMEALSILQSL